MALTTLLERSATSLHMTWYHGALVVVVDVAP